MMSDLLYKHHGQRVILLMDEYDVPLDKAFQNGYYDEMVVLIRALFGDALKTNSSLYFAVLTGALRVSKESIFTGINNLLVHSITDVGFDEYFGFTEKEVRELLEKYDLLAYHNTIKEWYDGYYFGKTDVYCPWDVLSYGLALYESPDAQPQTYWSNTSGNDIIRHLAEMADEPTRSAIEQLIRGASIDRKIKQELTYNELYSTIDNVWTVLFLTGYLTQTGRTEDGKLQLIVPNREIHELFVAQIKDWFEQKISQDSTSIRNVIAAILVGDTQGIEDGLNVVMRSMISYFDAPESFYHGFLMGILGQNSAWTITSNVESGEGRCDIRVRNNERRIGYLFELKYAKHFANLPQASADALAQIEDKRYADGLLADGIRDIWQFGIAFHKKWCRVMANRVV
jgi:hypothetical protein